jgi:hypothetical protein
MKLPKNVSLDSLRQALGDQKFEEVVLLVYGSQALNQPLASSGMIRTAKAALLSDEVPEHKNSTGLGRLAWHFNHGDGRRLKAFEVFLDQQLQIAEESEANGRSINSTPRVQRRPLTPEQLEAARAQAARMREVRMARLAERKAAAE